MKMTNRTRRITKTRRTKHMRTIITQRLLFSVHTVSFTGCNMNATLFGRRCFILLLPLLLRMRYSRTG